MCDPVVVGKGDSSAFQFGGRAAGLTTIQLVHLSTIRASIAKRPKVPRDNP
jgi:hypothetical protein